SQQRERLEIDGPRGAGLGFELLGADADQIGQEEQIKFAPLGQQGKIHAALIIESAVALGRGVAPPRDVMPARPIEDAQTDFIARVVSQDRHPVGSRLEEPRATPRWDQHADASLSSQLKTCFWHKLTYTCFEMESGQWRRAWAR